MFIHKPFFKKFLNYVSKFSRPFETRYDVAISVNGTDYAAQEKAESIANLLAYHGIKTYYYLEPEEATLMPGKNLEDTLKEVYCRAAKIVIVIASQNYAIRGFTRLEWGWIQQRRKEHPNEYFLIPVRLPGTDRKNMHQEVSKLAFVLDNEPKKDNEPREIINLIFKRLGKKKGYKFLHYQLLIAIASGFLLFRYWKISYIDPLVSILCFVTILIAIIWWIIFRLLPEYRPNFIYRPSNSSTPIFRLFYINLSTEKIIITSLIFLLFLSNTLLPSLELRIEEHVKIWLSEDTTRNTVSQNFFNSIKSEVALEVWTRILINRNYGGQNRGKALDMIYRLLNEKNVMDEAKEKDISKLVRKFKENRKFNLDNLHASLIGVDFRQTSTLDYSTLTALSFVGDTESQMEGVSLKQAIVAGGYFYTVDMSNADFSSTDFSNSTFIGVSGNPSFFRAKLENANFFGCNLNGTNFEQANLTGTTFRACQLRGTDFTNAVLTGVSFIDCDLTDSVFVAEEVKWMEVWGFLSGVVFEESFLDNVQFKGANFESGAFEMYRKNTYDLGYKPTTVYSRLTSDSEFTLSEKSPIATFVIPAATFFKTSLINTSFDEVKAQGIYMDTETYINLNDKQKIQLAKGGFEKKTLIDSSKYSDIVENKWDYIKNILDQSFKVYETSMTGSDSPTRLKHKVKNSY